MPMQCTIHGATTWHHFGFSRCSRSWDILEKHTYRVSHNWCHTLAQFLFHSHSVSVRGISSGLATRASMGSDSHVTSRPPRLLPIGGCIEGIFTGYKARGIQVSRWQGRRVCSLAAELAAWLDAKWPRGELLKCHAYLILPLVSVCLLPWANSHLKILILAGPVMDQPSGKKHRGQVCRKKRQFDEKHGRKADGQRSPGSIFPNSVTRVVPGLSGRSCQPIRDETPSVTSLLAQQLTWGSPGNSSRWSDDAMVNDMKWDTIRRRSA